MAVSTAVLFFAFLQIFATVFVPNSAGEIRDSSNLSILIVGKGGSGSFGTAAKLLQDKVKKSKSPSTVIEYKYQVNTTLKEGEFRLAVATGLVDDKTEEEDAATLNSLREYIQSPNGLNGTTPSIVLIVSRFDDILAHRPDSDFNYMLRKLNSLKRILFSDQTQQNVIFHFNFLMVRPDSETLEPNSTIDYFRNAIRQHGDFEGPIRITIGENRPEDYDLPMRGRSAVLPNGQLYPQNIIDEVTESLHSQSLWAKSDVFKAAIRKIETINPRDITVTEFSSTRYLDQYKKILGALQVLRDVQCSYEI